MNNKAKIVEALKALQINAIKWENNELVDLFVSPDVIERDGEIIVHGEGEYGQNWIDYYGEFRGGYPWIHPVLENFAKEHGLHWEWNNPASISLWD